MEKKLLKREVEQIALARLEDGARTEKDFREVVKQWNHLDQNRERRERYNEVSRPNEEMLHWDKVDASDKKGKLRSTFGAVIPPPLVHPYWRQLMRGDFIETIYDNPDEIWQLVSDKSIYKQLKDLTEKQKEVLFSRVVRRCPASRVSSCHKKTDRAVRKLLTATLEKIRKELAVIIKGQIEAGSSNITFAKKQFLEWYENLNCDLESEKNRP